MKSQNQSLLEYMRTTRRHVDPVTALEELGIYRLAARIYELRKAGCTIQTTRARDGTNNRSVAFYSLVSCPAHLLTRG